MGERKGERYGGEIGRTPLNFARQAASPPPPLLLSFSPYTIHLVIFLSIFSSRTEGGGGRSSFYKLHRLTSISKNVSNMPSGSAGRSRSFI
jgi:hypothetical protein